MRKPLIQQVAELLDEHGPMSTRHLGLLLGRVPERIGDALRHARSRGRYGLQVTGKVLEGGRGGPSSLWSVDSRVLHRYLAERGPYSETTKVTRAELQAALLKQVKAPKPKVKAKTKRSTPKEPKADYTPRKWAFNGPHRTVWQPSSPYFKGASNEHASTAQGA